MPLPILRGEERHDDEDLFGVHGGVSDDLPMVSASLYAGNRSQHLGAASTVGIESTSTT
jgi:hypothetical protein